jgi:hypothetical protein
MTETPTTPEPPEVTHLSIAEMTIGRSVIWLANEGIPDMTIIEALLNILISGNMSEEKSFEDVKRGLADVILSAERPE